MYPQLMTDIKKKVKNSVVLHLEKTLHIFSQQTINAAAGEKRWSPIKLKYYTVKRISELTKSEITHWFKHKVKFNINATLSKR